MSLWSKLELLCARMDNQWLEVSAATSDYSVYRRRPQLTPLLLFFFNHFVQNLFVFPWDGDVYKHVFCCTGIEDAISTLEEANCDLEKEPVGLQPDGCLLSGDKGAPTTYLRQVQRDNKYVLLLMLLLFSVVCFKKTHKLGDVMV